MTDTQRDAMIAMHRKMQAAYTRFGQHENAAQAAAAAKQLEHESDSKCVSAGGKGG